MDELRVSTTWENVVPLTATEDLAAPVYTSGFPKIANIDVDRADLQVSMDEAGKAYFVVVPDGATAPTVAETVAGVNYGSVTLAAAGTIDVVAGNTVYSATITGLTDKTNYDIYVVAEDDETTPNRQTDAIMVNLYTIRPPDVILNANFETPGSLSPFTQVSVTGDQIWTQTVYGGNGYAKISGYSGSALENIDWLISPAINLASAESNMVSFLTAMSYTGPAFKVMISSDFDGTFTPAGITAATWTDITTNFALSTANFTWVPSGEYSLTGYTGTVYIAFVYESSSTEATTWEVDDFRITGYLLPGSDATLSELMVDGNTVTGFDPATLEYIVNLDPNVTVIPTVTYTTADPAATTNVTLATDLSGNAAARTTTIVVTAADGVTKMTYKIIFEPIVSVANLAALRTVAPADYSRTYMITGEVVVTGINATQRGQKYIQDASAGVLIDDPDGIITTTYAVGDGITGIKGTLLDYYDMLEFVPTSDPGAASSTGNTVTPQTITVTEFNTNFENYEAELVKITGIDFTAADGTVVFETKKNYDVSVGTDVTVIRTVFLSTDLTGTVLP
ncbi:MAG: choice-of-anchor J domain-containing protein, partial [Bacteroidales bacterium]|nr:choice-of-anchor J domain-containing protein [Bacteroidales bacterium]